MLRLLSAADSHAAGEPSSGAGPGLSAATAAVEAVEQASTQTNDKCLNMVFVPWFSRWAEYQHSIRAGWATPYP